MIFRHKRTGKLYKHLVSSFDVSRQEHHEVYMQIETGHIFNRESGKFVENFELVDELPQHKIIRKEPHE